MKMQSALSKSSSSTVPLPMPIDFGRPTLVASWHMFEQSGKLLVPSARPKQLEQEGRLVGGSSRGIELDRVGARQGAEHGGDARERGVPFDRAVGFARPVI